LDTLTVTDVRTGVVFLAGLQELGQSVVQPSVVKFEVDESGPGNIDRDDMSRRLGIQNANQRHGQGSRIGARSLGRDHGDIGRPVTMLASGGPFEVDGGRFYGQI
jgi:hypothetical protein